MKVQLLLIILVALFFSSQAHEFRDDPKTSILHYKPHMDRATPEQVQCVEKCHKNYLEECFDECFGL